MTRVERGQMTTVAGTLERLEDLAAQRTACSQRQRQERTALQEELRAVTQALTALDTTLHTLALQQHGTGRAREEQTIVWCQTVQREIAHVTATARRTGRQLLWSLWGSAVTVGSVTGLLGLLVGSWWAVSWAPTPHEPFAEGHALPRVGKPPARPAPAALQRDLPEREKDAPSPPETAQTQKGEEAGTGED